MPLLDLDAELAEKLTEAELAEARPHVVGDLHRVRRGTWDPPPERPLAVLVLDGPLLLQRTIASSTGVELLGDGDIVLLGRDGAAPGFLEVDTTWLALDEAKVICLDDRFGRALRQWPKLGVEVMERTEQRTERVVTLNAISQHVRVDTRVLLALWYLSERWGHVTPDGVLLEVALTHRMLASVVGARRPSVTTAISQLQRTGRLERRDEGWLLLGAPPDVDGTLVAGPWSTSAVDGGPSLAG